MISSDLIILLEKVEHLNKDMINKRDEKIYGLIYFDKILEVLHETRLVLLAYKDYVDGKYEENEFIKSMTNGNYCPKYILEKVKEGKK